MLCSFTYVVAQIYGVGLIASRLTGVQFEIGIMLGLGGVLCVPSGRHAGDYLDAGGAVHGDPAGVLDTRSWLAYKQLGNRWHPSLPATTGQDRAAGRRPAGFGGGAPGGGRHLQRARDYEARLTDVPAALAREREATRTPARCARRTPTWA